jgi:peptidyl-prolyl cis-trans isomerase SurA
VVTRFEVKQRARFLSLLNSPDSSEEGALKTLINERLQLDAARAAGIEPEGEQIADGMEEFAKRANLTTDQFIKAIAGSGIARESFRDFVAAGLAWRELVRAKFGPRAQITEAEIDRAVALSSSKGGIRVLLSEIILPANTPQATAQAKQLAPGIARLSTIGAFAARARQYSASPSRGRGGRLPWMPLGNLPPEIRGQILALSPGQVTAPISIPNAIALFQLRAIEETDAQDVKDVSLEYAAYYIPGGHSDAAMKEAARIKARVDTCDDMFAIAKGKPAEQLQVDTLPIADVPGDVALELAKLDPGEVSTALTRSNGETLVFLMLCGRTPELAGDVSREEIRSQLVNQRMVSYAGGYLAELAADAHITYP